MLKIGIDVEYHDGENKIKACSFCGGEGTHLRTFGQVIIGNIVYELFGVQCDCGIDGFVCDTKERAIQTWNDGLIGAWFRVQEKVDTNETIEFNFDVVGNNNMWKAPRKTRMEQR